MPLSVSRCLRGERMPGRDFLEIHEDMATNELLQFFAFPSGWMEHGLVTEEFLREQHAFWETGVDPCLEHYRYRAFCAWIQSRSSITDEELEAWISVALADPDQTTSNAIIGRLLQWEALSKAQEERLASHARTLHDVGLKRLADRVQLMRRVREEPLTEELFETCVASMDREVHLLLLEHTMLSKEQRGVLAERGSSRAIRNQTRRTH